MPNDRLFTNELWSIVMPSQILHYVMNWWIQKYECMIFVWTVTIIGDCAEKAHEKEDLSGNVDMHRSPSSGLFFYCFFFHFPISNHAESHARLEIKSQHLSKFSKRAFTRTDSFPKTGEILSSVIENLSRLLSRASKWSSSIFSYRSKLKTSSFWAITYILSCQHCSMELHYIACANKLLRYSPK